MNMRPPIGSVTPHIICRDAAKMIDFYKAAFGATEMFRLPDGKGKLMHASISINGNTVMMVDEFPEWKTLSPLSLGGSPALLHLMVDDVDAALDKAVAAGATLVMPAADMFWGDRYGIVEDPSGHRWSMSTPKENLTPEQIAENMKKMGPHT
jgi:PhnB protein